MAPRKSSASTAGKEKKPATRRRRKKAEPASRGLSADQVTGGSPPESLEPLKEAIAGDGGVVIGAYRDPLGGHWHLLAGLPIERVSPTPFQRDLSETHVKKLTGHFVTFIATDVAGGNPNGDPANDFGVHVITLSK